MATSKKTGKVTKAPTKRPSAKKANKFNQSQKGKKPGKTKEERLAAITSKHRLTYFHKVQIVPLVVEKLQKATSKSRFVSGPEICHSIYKHHGIKINSGLLRTILHYIRINGIVKCLLATGQGYYITNDTLEMQTYLKTLQSRIKQIGILKKALDAQGHEVLGKQISSKITQKIKTKKRK